MRTKHYVISFLLLIQLSVILVSAQDKPKVGDAISGVVLDSFGPMIEVTIYEKTPKDSIVAISITNMEGRFSLKVVNKDDRLWVTYPGYDTVDIPIDSISFEIKLKQNQVRKLNPVYIVE